MMDLMWIKVFKEILIFVVPIVIFSDSIRVLTFNLFLVLRLKKTYFLILHKVKQALVKDRAMERNREQSTFTTFWNEDGLIKKLPFIYFANVSFSHLCFYWV